MLYMWSTVLSNQCCPKMSQGHFPWCQLKVSSAECTPNKKYISNSSTVMINVKVFPQRLTVTGKGLDAPESFINNQKLITEYFYMYMF